MQRFDILMYSLFWVCCGKQLHWWTGCWQVLYPFHAKEPSRCCIVWSQVEKMNCYLQVMTTVWRDGTSGHLSITSSPTCCSLIASDLISFMYEEYLTIGKSFLFLVLNMLYNDSAFCTSKAQFRFPKLITYAALPTLQNLVPSEICHPGHLAAQKRCWFKEPAGSTISQLHGTHVLCWGNPASEVLLEWDSLLVSKASCWSF